jgi:hypothetical protein
MEFYIESHEIFHGIPWNFMELRLMELEFHKNSVNSWNFMKFGFDREMFCTRHLLGFVGVCIEEEFFP